jgi:putative NADH-flavin reductase
MKLAVFGATGRVGSELLPQALAAGHEVRALVRNPSKVEAQASGLMVLQGDVKAEAAVTETLTGCDAVLSTLGANGNDAADTRRTGTANIMAAMHRSGIRRLVIVGGFHLHVPGDPGNFGQRLIVPILRLSRNLVQDTTAMGALVLESDLDWTLVRIPRVVHGQPTHSSRTGNLKLGPWSKVTRGDAANFMLRCVNDNACVRQAPMVSS